jgi:hypothetical protein
MDGSLGPGRGVRILRFGISGMRAIATACRRFRYDRNVAGMCRINGTRLLITKPDLINQWLLGLRAVRQQ